LVKVLTLFGQNFRVGSHSAD